LSNDINGPSLLNADTITHFDGSLRKRMKRSLRNVFLSVSELIFAIYTIVSQHALRIVLTLLLDASMN